MLVEEDNSFAQLARARNEFNVIRTRIDTNDLLKKIHEYLSGQVSFDANTDDGIQRITIKTGMPKANQHGIQSIMSWVTNSINTHTVQGNFLCDGTGYSKMYEDYIYYFRIDFGCYLMNNLYAFDISTLEYEGIIDNVMNILVPFMTRLISDGERRSYNETTRSVESNRLTTGSKGILGFGG